MTLACNLVTLTFLELKNIMDKYWIFFQMLWKYSARKHHFFRNISFYSMQTNIV